MDKINFQPETKTEIKNKTKTIKITTKNNQIFKIDFINKVNTLLIEAILSKEINSEIYSKEFTLKDIKKVKFFNDDYKSIDECLLEIFDKLDKEEEKIELKNEELIISIPLYSKKYPEIIFNLKKREKNEKEKYNELYDIIIQMKKNQEREVKALKDRINYLEDLLKIKKNEDKNIEKEFKGTIIKIKCFGKSEIDKYIDLNQYYICKENPIIFSFSFNCDDSIIPFAIESFNKVKKKLYGDNSNYIFTRAKNNKIFVDILKNIFDELDYDEPENKEKDFLDRIKETLPLFFASGQSLTIRTNAIPKDLFEKIEDEEIERPKKAKKLILDTELEFDNLLPQNLLFSFFFNEFINKEENYVDNYVKIISKDIFLNATEGNYKYKIISITF